MVTLPGQPGSVLDNLFHEETLPIMKLALVELGAISSLLSLVTWETEAHLPRVRPGDQLIHCLTNT